LKGAYELVIHSVVSGLDEAELSRIPQLKIIGARAGGLEIETPRYDFFTRILVDIARRGHRARDWGSRGAIDAHVARTARNGRV
jgi:hypothetical protein